MDELINRLSRYTEKAIADALDPDFAKAVQQTIKELKDCRNELCNACGQYRVIPPNECDTCRWRN